MKPLSYEDQDDIMDYMSGNDIYSYVYEDAEEITQDLSEETSVSYVFNVFGTEVQLLLLTAGDLSSSL
jgi:hypothetical protein